MPELSPQNRNRVLPLIEASGMRGHLALVYEVIDGLRPGVVFVDNPDHPRTALVCNLTGFHFAFGEPDDACSHPLLAEYWRRHLADNYTTVFGSTPAWEQPLARFFLPLGSKPEPRLAFELREWPAPLQIPPGFDLRPIDARLAQSIVDGGGTGGFGIDPWFIRIAGGPAAYAARGLGLALVQGNQIASIAGVCGLARGELELEVGTTPAYARRGLATVVTSVFMQQCRERGLIPAYSTTSRNIASIKVALKLGYEIMEEIPGYHYQYD